MNAPINLIEKLSKLDDYWSPRIIGEVDDTYIKIAKLKGTLAWHKHDDEDELFLVIKGRLKIEMVEQTITLDTGELFIVPKGIMHNPIAEEECSVLLIERKSTKHTGDLVIDITKSVADQLKPL